MQLYAIFSISSAYKIHSAAYGNFEKEIICLSITGIFWPSWNSFKVLGFETDGIWWKHKRNFSTNNPSHYRLILLRVKAINYKNKAEEINL